MAIEDQSATLRQQYQAPVADQSTGLVVQKRRDQKGADRDIKPGSQGTQADRAGKHAGRRTIELEKKASRDVEDPRRGIELQPCWQHTRTAPGSGVETSRATAGSVPGRRRSRNGTWIKFTISLDVPRRVPSRRRSAHSRRVPARRRPSGATPTSSHPATMRRIRARSQRTCTGAHPPCSRPPDDYSDQSRFAEHRAR